MQSNSGLTAAMVLRQIDNQLQDITARFNTLFRILWEKKLLTREDLVNSLKKESEISKKLEEKASGSDAPNITETDDMIELSADLIIAYLECDMDKMTDLQKDLTVKLHEITEKLRKEYSNKIEVADASALDKLNKISDSGKKLIL